MNKWLAFALAALVALGSIGGVWGQLSDKIARSEERLHTVEKRQVEDRETLRRDQGEIKQDVKQVASDVQQILRKLDSMEAVRRAERR